jgi:hypothetical protein
MEGRLVRHLAAELAVSKAEARTLVAPLRQAVAAYFGELGEPAEPAVEPEDLLALLRRPRLFGHFAARVLDEGDVPDGVRTRLVHRAFDLIEFPDEDVAVLTRPRTPAKLPTLVRYLQRQGEFTSYHALHLIHALYLDPEGVLDDEGEAVEDSFRRYLASDAATPRQKVLYTYLVLCAARSPRLQNRLFEAFLASPEVSDDAKADLCRGVLRPDEGLAAFRAAAWQEDLIGDEEPAAWVLAVLPGGLPEGVTRLAQGWRRAHREP